MQRRALLPWMRFQLPSWCLNAHNKEWLLQMVRNPLLEKPFFVVRIKAPRGKTRLQTQPRRQHKALKVPFKKLQSATKRQRNLDPAHSDRVCQDRVSPASLCLLETLIPRNRMDHNSRIPTSSALFNGRSFLLQWSQCQSMLRETRTRIDTFLPLDFFSCFSSMVALFCKYSSNLLGPAQVVACVDRSLLTLVPQNERERRERDRFGNLFMS